MHVRPIRPAPVARAAVACALALAGGLVACGDGGDGDATTNTTLPPNGEVPVNAELEVRYDHPNASFEYRIQCEGGDAEVSGDADAAEIGADTACLSLGDAGAVERLTTEPPEDQVCTEIYGGPDVAQITGTLDSDTVDITLTREDGCAIHDWDLLSEILPTPMGVTDETTG